MLRVTVEIVPHGVESMAYPLTTLYVCNDGTGTSDVGHYDVYDEDPRGQDYPREDRRGWISKITPFSRAGHDRRRDILAAEALRRASDVRSERTAA